MDDSPNPQLRRIIECTELRTLVSRQEQHLYSEQESWQAQRRAHETMQERTVRVVVQWQVAARTDIDA